MTAARAEPVPVDGRPDFEPAQHALGLYYRALSGRECEIVPYDDDADSWQHPDTVTSVRLPSHAPVDPDGPIDRSAWYRVAMTHRALHHALGTFALDLQRPEPFFRKLRPAEQPEPRPGAYPAPPLERFVRLFGRTALAIEMFALLEDVRVDAAALRLYAGLE
ncbi:MAG TPA: hypothetical protein VH442_03285, partial [Micromonosporaceae bacterium]